MKKFTPTFILATLGLIFVYDAIVEWFGSHATISETITNWINISPTNLIIFLSGVIILCVHFIWGYYKDKSKI